MDGVTVISDLFRETLLRRVKEHEQKWSRCILWTPSEQERVEMKVCTTKETGRMDRNEETNRPFGNE